MSTLTLVHGDERVEVTAEQAAAVTEYLWKGLLPGAVVSAAKLSVALDRVPEHGRSVEFEAYEWPSVRGALDALGRRRTRKRPR
jgi:hypothetical protein